MPLPPVGRLRAPATARRFGTRIQKSVGRLRRAHCGAELAQIQIDTRNACCYEANVDRVLHYEFVIRVV